MKLLQLSIYALLFFTISCKKESSNTEKQGGPKIGNASKAISVEGLIANYEPISGSISSSGSILAHEEVEIKSEVSGKVVGIYFREGQAVTKGQLLVKLNDDDLKAQINKLEIEIKLADEKEKRYKQLLASAAISKEEYDIAETNLNLLRANVAIIKTSIDKTKITAPFTGVAGLKNICPGAFITNATVITTVQSVQPLKLDFSIPEKYNSMLKIGTNVTFHVMGDSKTYSATVYAKEPKIDQDNRTAKIRAQFSNPGGRLSPGSFAEVVIPIGNEEKAIMIPTIAYIPDISGAKVFVSKGGQAVSVPVKAGIRTSTSLQILEGIQIGDTVLTTGILQLKPKTPVNVKIINKAD